MLPKEVLIEVHQQRNDTKANCTTVSSPTNYA